MRTCGQPWTALWLFLILSVPVLGVAPAAAQPVAPQSLATARSLPSMAHRSASPPLAAWYDNLWSKIWAKIYNSLNSRTGVIQWGLIGMLLALWIIWWRK